MTVRFTVGNFWNYVELFSSCTTVIQFLWGSIFSYAGSLKQWLLKKVWGLRFCYRLVLVRMVVRSVVIGRNCVWFAIMKMLAGELCFDLFLWFVNHELNTLFSPQFLANFQDLLDGYPLIPLSWCSLQSYNGGEFTRTLSSLPGSMFDDSQQSAGFEFHFPILLKILGVTLSKWTIWWMKLPHSDSMWCGVTANCCTIRVSRFE